MTSQLYAVISVVATGFGRTREEGKGVVIDCDRNALNWRNSEEEEPELGASSSSSPGMRPLLSSTLAELTRAKSKEAKSTIEAVTTSALMHVELGA